MPAAMPATATAALNNTAHAFLPTYATLLKTLGNCKSPSRRRVDCQSSIPTDLPRAGDAKQRDDGRIVAWLPSADGSSASSERWRVQLDGGATSIVELQAPAVRAAIKAWSERAQPGGRSPRARDC